MKNVQKYLKCPALDVTTARYSHATGPTTQYRAGHFRYFCIFSIIKNDLLYFLSS